MYNYAPAAFRPGMAQAAAPTAAVTPAVAVVPAPTMLDTALKVGASALTVGVFSTAAYLGYEKVKASRSPSQKAIGWVAGLGSAVLGLATVASIVAPPKVTQALLLPFNLPASV